MSTLRMFPIQAYDCPGSPSSIPWAMLDDGWAQHNHGGQNLEHLASRGGLGPCEAIAIIERRPWRKMDDAGPKLAALVKADTAGHVRAWLHEAQDMLTGALNRGDPTILHSTAHAVRDNLRTAIARL